MSSTTERSERGQILVLFAGGLAVLFVIAALAFDVGMTLLERRTEQNGADAAALAGARYVLTSATFHGSCASSGGNAAAVAACDVALANDFDDADASENVLVDIPPIDGQYRGLAGFVEVRINARRSSIFAGVIGRGSWDVGVRSVAADQPGVNYPFGMLALSQHGCKAILISGTGVVNVDANVQSNSDGADCGSGGTIGLARTGGGVLNVTAPDATCRSVGTIQDQGSGSMSCVKDPLSFALPDPLATLAAPTKPGVAAAVKEVSSSGTVIDTPTNVPNYCPGSTDPTKAPDEAAPHLCVFGQGSDQTNRKWILYPGLYPGGLELKGGVTAYLMPGIYWIGGGGFKATNDASTISVNSETDRAAAVCTTGPTPPCTGGGGILIYNSVLPGSLAGPIVLGGGGATLNLQPYDYPFGTTTIDLVIFQDRTVALAGDDVTLNGSSAQAASVRGIIYLPNGDLKVNGSSSEFTMDQVIAQTFQINGNGGTVNVLRELGIDAIISAVGLVE